MPPRTRRRTRAGLVSAVTSLALLGLVPTVTAGSAQAEDTAFAPQLVTVDTPTREHKRLLQSLGLDLTEHAGHDYVEVVLHNGLDRDLLAEAGSELRRSHLRPEPQGGREQRGQRRLRRRDHRVAAAVRPRHLPRRSPTTTTTSASCP